MELRRGVKLDLEPDLVWELLTLPAELATWLGAEVELDPVPGSTGHVVDDDGTERRLVVEEVEEGRLLVWRWWPVEGDRRPDGEAGEREAGDEDDDGGAVTRVEITVTPSGDGTLVRVVERPIAPAPVTLAPVVSARSGERWSARAFDLEVSALVRSAVVAAVR